MFLFKTLIHIRFIGTLYLGKCGTFFPVLRCTVQAVSVYTCSIESSVFSFHFTNLSFFCVGAGCDVSNGHMKHTKCLLFPST
jgi:hypothetical protein